MVLSAIRSERRALDELEPELWAKGYQLVRQPAESQLPPFLVGLSPDAIATGRSPSLVIEVFQKGNRAEVSRIEQLRESLKGHSDWDLRLIYYISHEPVLTPTDIRRISETLGRTEAMAATEPNAALLMAWAVLEATAREQIAELGERPLRPRSVVNALLTEGLITQEQGEELLTTVDLRNRIAHGQLDIMVEPNVVQKVLEIARGLLEPAA